MKRLVTMTALAIAATFATAAPVMAVRLPPHYQVTPAPHYGAIPNPHYG